MLKKASLVCAVWLLLAGFGLAQENRFDVFLGATGAFSKESSGNGVTLKPTASIGELVSLDLRINPHHGLAFHYGQIPSSTGYKPSSSRRAKAAQAICMVRGWITKCFRGLPYVSSIEA
jgi:hypothetical protein